VTKYAKPVAEAAGFFLQLDFDGTAK